MVQANEPVLSRTDVSGSKFEVGAPTSEEGTDRKKSQAKRAPKSLLTVVLESWLLSILHCRFFSHISGSFLVFFQVMPKRFRGFPEMKICRLVWRLMGS